MYKILAVQPLNQALNTNSAKAINTGLWTLSKTVSSLSLGAVSKEHFPKARSFLWWELLGNMGSRVHVNFFKHLSCFNGK